MPALALIPAGLIFGSFATAVAYRLPRGESVLAGRSRCTSCGAAIAAYDNIPVLSWLLLRGRCRRCHERISPRYPLTELGSALLFALVAVVIGTGDPVALALGLALALTLVTITLTDLEKRVIPNRILLVSALGGLAIVAIGDPASLPERFAAALGASGVFLLAALAYPRGMGMGDVKLAAVLGLYLGRDVFPALFVALAAGALVGIAMMLRHGPGARKQAIPFGPFLALGGIVGLLAGREIVNWYVEGFLA